MAETPDGETLPLDAGFKRAVDRLEEIIAVRLRLKADEIRAEQTVEQFALPRADAEGFGIRPRNVPEDRDANVRPRILDHARKQSEVIILHKKQGMLRAGHLFEHGVGKLAIHLLIALPIGGAKERPRVSDVAQGPKAFVRKSVVVALFLFLGEPDAAKSIFRLVRRHAQTIVAIHRFAIRRSGAMSDPRAITGTQNRLERGDETAGRNHRLDSLPSILVHVRLAIRYYEKRAENLRLNADAQALGRPKRLAAFAQARLLLRGSSRLRKAAGKLHHLLRKGSEETLFRQLGTRAHSAASQVLHPLRGTGNRKDDRPANDENGEENDEEHLRDDVPDRLAPDGVALRLDVTRIVKNCEDALRFAVIVVHSEVVRVHRLAAESDKFADALALCRQTIQRNPWRRDSIRKTRAFSKNFSGRIVDDDPRETFAIFEAIHDATELHVRAMLDGRFDNLRQALAQNLGAPLQIGAKAALLGANLIP